MERNETTIFIFSLFLPSPINFGLKRWQNAIFEFFEFFAIFLKFSISCRAGMKQNVNFYFLFFSVFSNQFWFEMRPYWYFLIFWILLLFFWNFLFRVGLEQNETIIFIFSLSQPFPTYYGLKWSHNGIFLIFWIVLLFFWNLILRVWTER